MNDLTSTCTANQKLVYPAIDGLEGAITKVEMRGGQAEEAFDMIKGSKQIIQLETGVEFWVNQSNSDFTKYVPRPRKK